MALDKEGNVYSWGDNPYGQLGTGDVEDHTRPSIIEGLPKMKEIACGSWHAMAVTTNGKVWTSDSTTVCVSNFLFTQLVQETDTTGDYMKFQAEFSCTLRNSDYGVIDSAKCVENGFIKSAFRLD